MAWVGVSRGAQVTGVAVCSLSLTWISTVLRFYVRLGILKFVGREDWLTVAAMILFTILCALCLHDIGFGLGAHMYNISKEGLEIGFKIMFICELLYVVVTAVVKLAIGAFFLRLSSKRYQVYTVYVTLTVVLVISTMYFFFLLFQCTPISYLWAKYVEGTGKCLSGPILTNVTYAHAAMSAVTDWAFGILPIFFVWNIHMDPRTKITVILVLSLGFFASTATIVRIVYIRSLTLTDDYSWEGINLVKWSLVEPAIAITAMNIATLRPMFKNFFFFARKRFDHSTDSSDNTRPSGESTVKLRSGSNNNNTVSAKEYSVEFAEMLGLSRVGVTTEISAGGSKSERSRLRSRFQSSRMGVSLRDFKTEKVKHDSESQTELNEGLSIWHLDGSASDPLDWSQGIKATTVITRVDDR